MQEEPSTYNATSRARALGDYSDLPLADLFVSSTYRGPKYTQKISYLMGSTI